MSRGESALSRWARLKQESRQPELKEAPAANLVAQESQAEPEVVNVEDLPDIDSLTAESDFSVFLKEGVPEHLKKLALRKLWASDPVFANLDGLNDYDEDFSVIVPLAKEVVKEIQDSMERTRRELTGEPDEEETDEALKEKEGDDSPDQENPHESPSPENEEDEDEIDEAW